MLLIRGQTLSIDDLLAFGRRFGELARGAPVHIGQQPRNERHPELAIISNVIENGVAIGGLGDGEAVWHTDSGFTAIPPSCSILYSVEIPPSGADTGFTNMYAALDSLPAELRARLAGLTIKHDQRYTSGGQLREGYQWRLGDVLIWDNRCTMHRRDSIPQSTRRIMHRTQCKGTPIEAGT